MAVWEHLNVNKTHVAYAVLAVFATFFSLFSLFVKEKLYIGEASVATIFGLIVGPHCLDWVNPTSWGNQFYITLEVSRILLCIEIIAVAVELPKKYIWKHFYSVFLLLIPVMTCGFLIIGLFIWLIIPDLKFSYGLLIAACITATDPVLAQAVVGKGKFAKRVPAHLRNLLSCESACNDGVSVPFVYLSLALILHEGKHAEIAKDFICVTVLYECVFGAIMGAFIGYAGRKLIRFAEDKDLIDRESLLAFYIMLAFLCAGFGSILGVDDLLASFAAGAAFAWDGWFTEKTEESQVTTVIDLILNLAYFVFFGTQIPWGQFNNGELGLDWWRLVCLALVVLTLRRIPAVFAIKTLSPDIKNWKEALFVGHFGPIGVGAVFAAIIAIGDLEAEVAGVHHGPTAKYPDAEHYHQLIRIIWPIVCFLIFTSIVVHGSSVAVMTLGRHLQTMTFTMTFTRADTNGTSSGWTSRLPRLEKSGTSFSIKRVDTMAQFNTDSELFTDEKLLSDRYTTDGGPLSNAPTIDTTDFPEYHVKAPGLKKRRHKRRLQKKRRRERKTVPVSETLDLRDRPAPVVLDLSGNGRNLPETYDVEGDLANQIPPSQQPEQLQDQNPDESIDSEKLDAEMNDQNVNTTGSSSTSTEAAKQLAAKQKLASEIPNVNFTTGSMERLEKTYLINDDTLKPKLDKDGVLKYPTHAYADKSQLVIEDQNGEILQTVKSRTSEEATMRPQHNLQRILTSNSKTSSVDSSSNISFKSVGSLKRVISKAAMKLNNMEHSNDESIKLEGHSKQMNPTEYADRKIQEIMHNSNPRQKTAIGYSNRKGTQKSQKFHGYRVDDDIIVENEEGEIVGRYKLNMKKKKTSKESGDTLSKALNLIGMKRQQQAQQKRSVSPILEDLEKGHTQKQEIVPELGTQSSKKVESKLKGFLKADPKKTLVKPSNTDDEFSSDEDEDQEFDDETDESEDNLKDFVEGESEFERARRLAALNSSGDRDSEDEEEEPKTKY